MAADTFCMSRQRRAWLSPSNALDADGNKKCKEKRPTDENKRHTSPTLIVSPTDSVLFLSSLNGDAAGFLRLSQNPHREQHRISNFVLFLVEE